MHVLSLLISCIIKWSNKYKYTSRPQVTFTSSQTLCDVSVESVLSSQTQEPIKYDIDTVMRADGYTIE